MSDYKGVYLREEEELFDPALREVLGDRYHDAAWEPEQESENNGAAETAGIWKKMKRPVLFAALVFFIGASAHFGLMDPMIAVPGMCVCSACFGWNVRCR